jgi:hypothetical protein
VRPPGAALLGLPELHRRRHGLAQVWIDARPEDVPGTALSFRLYADDPGRIVPTDTLAGAMETARRLGKPLVVGEAGMTTCVSERGSVVETPDGRARKLDAKLDAFFAAGGAGYLIWTWRPDSACAYAFTSGDPLNPVLAGRARRLAAPP